MQQAGPPGPAIKADIVPPPDPVGPQPGTTRACSQEAQGMAWGQPGEGVDRELWTVALAGLLSDLDHRV